MNYDVFNGDADGLCALIQLRQANPQPSTLITGVKRDISLLKQVTASAGDQVTVLDVSLDKNRPALLALLEQNIDVLYIDHHQADPIPEHPKLTALINTDANTCTSLLVDAYLQHRYTAWAVTAAFGDNLQTSAIQAAQRLDLSTAQLTQLEHLGICLNYNGYGATLEDLHFAPAELYRLLAPYASPFDFIAERPDIYQQLLDGYATDMALAAQTPCEFENGQVAVFILPDEKWARRVSGVWSNDLANQHPERAHAIVSYNTQGGYQLSVRAPLANKTGADELCAAFPTGGGRKAAAGINDLPQNELPAFIAAFAAKYAA